MVILALVGGVFKSSWLTLLGVAIALLQPQLGAAQTSAERIVWLEPSAALAAAARSAFDPAQLELLESTAGPADTLPLAAARDARALARGGSSHALPRDSSASALAHDHAARALVWTRSVAGTTTLYVYDAAQDRIVGTRKLPEAALDPATAAAIVLSVKTYLGYSAARRAPAMAPTSESEITGSREAGKPRGSSAGALVAAAPARAGAPKQRANSTPISPRSPSAATRRETTRHLSDSTAARDSTAAHDSTAAREAQPLPEFGRAGSNDDRGAGGPSSALEDRERWRLDLAAVGGMRAAMKGEAPELRYGVSAMFRTPHSAWGVGFEISSGSGFSAQRTRLDEPAAALLATWQLFEAAGWRASLIAGPALHWLFVRVAMDQNSEQSAQRLRPHIYSGVRLSWHAPQGFFVGAWASADVPLLRQRYWISDELTLEANPIAVSAQIAAGMPFRL